MDDLFSLLIAAAVVWSVIEGLVGKRRKGPPAPQRPEPRAPVPDVERDGGARVEAGRSGATSRGPVERSAGEMIPDDLWAILTGERRPAPAAPREPEPSWEAERSWEPEREREVRRGEAEPASEAGTRRGAGWTDAPGGHWSDEDALEKTGTPVLVPTTYEEARALEEMPAPTRPVVVSLETPPPPSEVRHRDFHARRARSEARRRSPAPDASRLHRALGGRRDLQRAVVLREVLGPPKGLE